MSERPPLSRALRDSTKLLHTDAERAGAMGALLRGRIDRDTYVAMLSSLHAIYGSLEDALHRHAEHASIAPLRVSGLERRDALAADLRALAGDAWPLTHPPNDLAVTYAAHLSTLGNNAPERLIAHAWLRYLGDLNGGQIVAKIVRNALTLDESSTAFYAFPDLDDPMRTAAAWRTALDALALSEDAKDAIVAEAADGFRRHIALFEGLAAQASAAPPPAAATPISIGYLGRVPSHGETDLPGPSAIEGSIIIGTRASKLALWQSHHVRDRLLALHPKLEIALERISTRGDEIQDRPLAAIGRNSLFVAEIEDALRSGRIRLAVHSAKDLPSTLAEDMTIVAYTERADPRDAFVSRAGKFADLPAGARIGTSSPRRACQLKASRPDIECLDIRGNVDTRLAKLERGEFDAIVLAAAGLERLGWLHVVTEFFEPDLMLPAVSQGILAIEGRTDDLEVWELCLTLDHAPSRACAEAERAFLAAMGAGCNAPLAGFATYEAGELALTALVGAPDGRTVRVSGRGSASNAAALGRSVASELVSGGGAALLEEAIAAQAAAAPDA